MRTSKDSSPNSGLLQNLPNNGLLQNKSISTSFSFSTLLVKTSVDSSPFSIISAIKRAWTFLNVCEKHLMHIMYFLTLSEQRRSNDNWWPPLVIFLLFQFFFFLLFPPYCLFRFLRTEIPEGCRSTLMLLTRPFLHQLWNLIFSWKNSCMQRIVSYPNAVS